MLWGISREGVGGAAQRSPARENFSKTGSKTGHSGVILTTCRCGGGHWICANIWVTHKLKTGGSNTIIA